MILGIYSLPSMKIGLGDLSIIHKIVGNHSGESLVETLAAILICTLASILLLGAVASATNLNIGVKNSRENLSEYQTSAETNLNPTPTPGSSITIDGDAISDTISYSGSGSVYSYQDGF